MKKWNKWKLRILASFLCLVMLISQPAFLTAAEVLVHTSANAAAQVLVTKQANAAEQMNAIKQVSETEDTDIYLTATDSNADKQNQTATSSNAVNPIQRSLYEQLMEADDLHAMVDIASECEDQLEDLTEEEVRAIQTKILMLINEIEEPTSEDQDNYLIMRTYMLEACERLEICTCGSSQNDHSSFCPLYKTYPTVIPNVTLKKSGKMRSKARSVQTDNSEIVTSKSVEAAEGSNHDEWTITIEAYATGTTTTTQYTKPADMVIVVDQSASMLYADVEKLSTGIPSDKTKSLTRADLENNLVAQKNASHGMYYMACGQNTLCFLVYKENKWYYYDTYLIYDKRSGYNDQTTADAHYGFNVSGDWDSNMEIAAPNWEYMNNRLTLVSDSLWTVFESHGIYPTRYGSAYWALVDFLESVSSTGVDHRISIVGFAGRDENETETLCELTYVNTEEGKATVRAAIDNILCTGTSTHHDAGIDIANDIFDENPVNLSERDRNLIFFSDGEGSYGTDNNKTLSSSYKTKNTYSATVYSVGTALAPPVLMEQLSSNYPDAQSTGSLGEKKSKNYYFHASSADILRDIFAQLSSTVGSTTVELDSTSYIKDVVTKYFTIPDGAESVTAYTVDCTGYKDGEPQWVESRTPVKQEDIKVEGNTVTVTGFDYAGNFVSSVGRVEGFTDQAGDFYGRKLVIEIIIKPQEEFLGGNHVDTNGPESGLYDSQGTPWEILEIPNVDVLTKATASIDSEINVYLGSVFAEQTGTDGQKHYGLGVVDLHSVLKAGYNGIPLDFSKENYGLDPYTYDYVDIQVDIFQPEDWSLDMDIDDVQWSEGPVVSMDEILWDTPYKLQITVTPKNKDGDCEPATAEATGWIRVFYPEITFHDLYDFYYGESPDSDHIKAKEEGTDQTGITISWVNESIKGELIYDTDVTMTMPADGERPAVALSYRTPVGMTSLPKTDVPVEVLVEQIGYLGTKSAIRTNQFVHFKWNSCKPDCGVAPIEDHQGIATSPEFYLHPQTCQLTIDKIGGASDEPYTFKVMKQEGDEYKMYTELSITGNGSKTLYELPVGTYKVEEDEKWSWRYKPEISQPVTLGRESLEGTITTQGEITCTNTKKENRWFNGFSDVIANVFGKRK